jgi:hypothetical protein
MSEVSASQLKQLRDPIRAALWQYAEMVDHRLTIDMAAASRLAFVPEKPNTTARATSRAKYAGQALGEFVVIAFSPGDGTGNEDMHRLTDLEHDGYPDEARIVPRPKTTTHSEGHLTILSMPADARNAEPVLYAGSLDLLGVSDGAIKKIAALGQSPEAYEASMGTLEAEPLVTATVGFSGGRGERDARYGRLAYEEKPRNRFGDPHAVFNATEDLQVCAFLNIPFGGAVYLKVPLLNSLNAVIPAAQTAP